MAGATLHLAWAERNAFARCVDRSAHARAFDVDPCANGAPERQETTDDELTDPAVRRVDRLLCDREGAGDGSEVDLAWGEAILCQVPVAVDGDLHGWIDDTGRHGHLRACGSRLLTIAERGNALIDDDLNLDARRGRPHFEQRHRLGQVGI